MLDGPLRRWLERPLARAGGYADAYLTANQVTVAGFVCGVAAAALVAVDLAPIGLAFFVLARAADAVDGAIARRRGPTELGGFLDAALDLIGYAGLAFAFAIREPSAALAACFFLLGFATLTMTELAFRYFARGRSVPAECDTKQIVSDLLDELGAARARGQGVKLASVGTFPVKQRLPAALLGHTETSIVLAIACAYPPAFPMLAYVFGAACFVSTGLRIAGAIADLRPAAKP